MKKLFFVMIIVLTFAACNNNATEKQEATSIVDSLLEQVVAGHDVAMPKIKKLERLQKEIQAALDSVNKLTPAQSGIAFKAALDNALKELNYASFAMDKWMQEFGYDSLKNNEAERIKYLQSELIKVNNMKDAVLKSISKADSLLKK